MPQYSNRCACKCVSFVLVSISAHACVGVFVYYQETLVISAYHLPEG